MLMLKNIFNLNIHKFIFISFVLSLVLIFAGLSIDTGLDFGIKVCLAKDLNENSTEGLLKQDNKLQAKAITFFPNMAELELQGELSVCEDNFGEEFIKIILPGKANLESLSLKLNQGTLLSLSSERLEAESPEDILLQPVYSELNRVRLELERLKAQETAIIAALNLWLNTQRPDTNIATELHNLEFAMKKSIPGLQNELLLIKPKIQTAQNNVNKLEKIVQTSLPSWQINVFVDNISTKEVELACSFLVSDASWTSFYRLNAEPDKGNVDLSVSAELWQNVGYDLSNVEVSLATVAPSVALEPPPLADWEIFLRKPELQPRPLAEASARGETADALYSVMPMAVNARAAVPAMPQEEVKTSYALWSLGQKTIPANTDLRYNLLQEKVACTFAYTLRPDLSGKGFLTALPKEFKAKDLPSGTALFLVDNKSIGTMFFNPTVSYSEIFFGPDSLLNVTLNKVADLTNQHKNKTQTRTWEWDIEVKNNRKIAVPVRVEMPSPQNRDERIKIALLSEPLPQQDSKHIYIWEKEIQPEATFAIKHKILLTAPTDYILDSRNNRR